MKTFKNLLPIVLVSILSLNAFAALVVPATPTVETPSTLNSQLVKATYYNGILIPVVDLPEFEVIGSKFGNVVLKAVKKDGELIAQVELPVIVIQGDRIQSNNQISINNDTYETIHDLPVIEIESTFPTQKLVKTEYSVDEYIAVIDLPEVTITIGGNTEGIQAFPSTFSGISDHEYAIRFYSLNDQKNSYFAVNHFTDEQINSIHSVSIENCIIDSQSKRICNLVLRLSQNASEGIKANLIQLITPN